MSEVGEKLDILTETTLEDQYLLRRCFRYLSGVQIPSQEAFGCLGQSSIYIDSESNIILSVLYSCRSYVGYMIYVLVNTAKICFLHSNLVAFLPL